MLKQSLLTGSVSLFALLAMAACGNEGGDPGATTEGVDVSWAHESSDLPADPAIRFGELENGMRYAILVNDTPPRQAALRLHIRMGSLYEADDQQGLAHFVEHMAFNGSENVPEGEMVKMLERFGLAFGPDTNAFTSFDQTVYQLDLPEVDEDTLDTGFFLMGELADNLLFDAEAIDRERGVVKSEERARDVPQLARVRDEWDFLFPDAAFPDRFPIGTVEVIETAPRERFLDLYNNFYTPDRALMVVVGDVDPDQIETKIRDTFSDWERPANAKGDPDLGTIGERSLAADYYQNADIPTILTINNPQPAENKPDTAANRREALLDSLAVSIMNRRFAKLARAEDAPFVQAAAGYQTLFDTADLASVTVVAQPDSWARALATGEQELRRALDYGFTEAELQEQLANIRTALKTAAESADTRQTTALANAIVAAVNEDNVFTHPETDLARFEAFAPQITPDMVWNAFKDQWEGAAPLLHLGTSADVQNAEEAILAAYRDSREVAVEAPEDAGGQEFAYTDFGPAGEVAERAEIEDLGTTTIRFANNVRLNFKQTDFEDSRVRARLRFGGGRLEYPREMPGLEVFLQVAFAQGGLEAHSLDELQTLLAGRNINLGVGMSGSAFTSNAVTTPDDLLLQMQVWAAYVTAPGYRPEAQAQYLQQINAVYDTLDATPQGIQQKDVPRLIRSGDPRYGLPSKEELLARTMEDLRSVMERPLDEGHVEITIVGDISEEDAIAAVAQTFGALGERPAEPELFTEARGLAFPDGGGAPVILRHAGKANRAAALVFWPGPDALDRSVSRKADLLEQVMSLKLIDTIREELGATYSPSSSSYSDAVNPGYGFFSVSLDLEPSAVDTLYTVVDGIAEQLRNGEISEDELERARKPLLEQFEESLENNGYWTNVLDEAQSRPDVLEDHRQRQAHYEGVTVEDLVAMANAYLTQEQAYRVSILPPEGAAEAEAGSEGE